MTSVDTCHICLEEIEFIETDLLKTCCNAFICNSCWIELQENALINNCPICGTTIFINVTIEDSSNIKKIVNLIILTIKLTILGNIILNLIYFIIYHNLKDYFKGIINLNKSPFYWITSYSLGLMLKYLCDKD